MPFKPGQSGNTTGRPKKEPKQPKRLEIEDLTKIDRSSLKAAWVKVTKRKPWLVEEAIERGLESARPIQYLELGAKLMREIGQDSESKTQIAIVFNGPIDVGKLKGNTSTPHVLEVQAHPQLPAGTTEAETIEVSLLEKVEEEK